MSAWDGITRILETSVSCLHCLMHAGEAPLTVVARWCIHWLYGEVKEIEEADIKSGVALRETPKLHHHSNAMRRRPVFSTKS